MNCMLARRCGYYVGYHLFQMWLLCRACNNNSLSGAVPGSYAEKSTLQFLDLGAPNPCSFHHYRSVIQGPTCFLVLFRPRSELNLS